MMSSHSYIGGGGIGKTSIVGAPIKGRTRRLSGGAAQGGSLTLLGPKKEKTLLGLPDLPWLEEQKRRKVALKKTLG